MKKTSILSELAALFDAVTDKICPILTTDAMTAPATLIRIVGAERSAGGMKLIFELRHRYRETDPSHAVSAMAYLERLCRAAEDTGKATLVSISGTSCTDGSVGECSARLEYGLCEQLRILAGDEELSQVVKRMTLEELSILRESRYIYDAHPELRRVGDRLCVILECTGTSVPTLLRAFGTEAVTAVFAVGSDGFRSSFVLRELSADGDVRVELCSSGTVEYGSVDENGELVPYGERRAI